MTRYTENNTEGYSSDELALLNRAYEAAVRGLDLDDNKSLADHIAERILERYDDGVRSVQLLLAATAVTSSSPS